VAGIVWSGEEDWNKESRIMIREINIDVSNPELWPDQHEWLIRKMERFREVFTARTKNLNAQDYVRIEWVFGCNSRRQRRSSNVLYMGQKVPFAAGAAFVWAYHVEVSERGGDRVLGSGLHRGRLDAGWLVDARGLGGDFDSEQ
jgi:hypothetical protein